MASLDWSSDDGEVEQTLWEPLNFNRGQEGLRALRTHVGNKYGNLAFQALDKAETVANEKILFPGMTALQNIGINKPGELLMDFYTRLGNKIYQGFEKSGYSIENKGYALRKI